MEVVLSTCLQFSLSCLPVIDTLLQTLLADLAKNIDPQASWEIIPMMSIQCCDLIKNLL